MIVLGLSTDLRGSVRVAHDAHGKAAAWFGYDPFGHALAAQDGGDARTAARLTRRYAGQVFEAQIGCLHYGARLYDAALARFVSTDPQHQTPSPYAYCANDPVDGTDPDGRGFEVVLYYPPNENSTTGYFRGYLYRSGQYIGFDLPEFIPLALRDKTKFGTEQNREGYLAWRQLTVYAEHLGMGFETRQETVKAASSQKREALWNYIVEKIWRLPFTYDAGVLPDALRRKAALRGAVKLKAPSKQLSFSAMTGSGVKLETRKSGPLLWSEVQAATSGRKRTRPADSDAEEETRLARRPSKRRRVAPRPEPEVGTEAPRANVPSTEEPEPALPPVDTDGSRAEEVARALVLLRQHASYDDEMESDLVALERMLPAHGGIASTGDDATAERARRGDSLSPEFD